MDPHGHFLCPVVRGQHTNAGLCVCTRACACTFKYGLQDSHPHGPTHMHAHKGVALGQSSAGWGLAPPGTARLPRPSAESARGQVGPGSPGNLSQLLCPVSGKPPAGVLPTEPACPRTCPPGFQEGPGRPCPQPCMPESTVQNHTTQGLCNPLPPMPSEPLTEPEETQAKESCSPRGVN